MEKAKAAQKSAPKSNKFGDVRKCPTCGAMVESFQTKCPECGYEFTNIEANNTTQKLLDALDAVNAQTTSQGAITSVLSGIARTVLVVILQLCENAKLSRIFLFQTQRKTS